MKMVLSLLSKLNKIAVKNKIVSETAYNFKDALRKISNKEKKLIVFWQPYTPLDQY